MKNKTILNGALFSLFSFFNQGVGFLLLILLANYIPPDAYGKLSLYNTIVMFMGYFVALSSQGYLSVSFFQSSKDRFRKDVSSILSLSIGFVLVFSVIIILFGNEIAKLFQLEIQFVWYALIVSWFTLFWNMSLDYLRVQEKISLYGIGTCGYAISNFVFSLLFVITLGQGWEGRVYSQLFCTLICGLLGIVSFFKGNVVTRDISFQDVEKIALWGIPLIPHQATIWIKQGCDRLIINNCYTLTEVGVFSFSLTLMSILVAVGIAFNSSFSVSIYKILSSNDDSCSKRLKVYRQERNAFIAYSITTIIILLSVFFLVPHFLPQYSASVPYFVVLSLAGFLQSMYFVTSNSLFYYGKNKRIMLITFSSSLFHLALSIIFTRYSLYFTSVIYVLSQLLVLLLIMHERAKLFRNADTIIH